MLAREGVFNGGMGRAVFGGAEMTGVLFELFKSLPLHETRTGKQQHKVRSKMNCQLPNTECQFDLVLNWHSAFGNRQ